MTSFTKENIQFEWGTLDFQVDSKENPDGLTGVIFRVDWRYKGTVVLPEPEDFPNYKMKCAEVNGIAFLQSPNPMTFIQIEELMVNKPFLRDTLMSWLNSHYPLSVKQKWQNSIYNKLLSMINPAIMTDSI